MNPTPKPRAPDPAQSIPKTQPLAVKQTNNQSINQSVNQSITYQSIQSIAPRLLVFFSAILSSFNLFNIFYYLYTYIYIIFSIKYYIHICTHTHIYIYTHTPQGPKSQTLNLRLKAHAFFCTVGLKGFTRIPVSLVRRLNSLSPRRAAAVLGCDHAHFRGKRKPLSVVCPGFGYSMYMKTACLCCHGQAYRGGGGGPRAPHVAMYNKVSRTIS